MERIIKIRAAYDTRHTDPKKNYGIHGVQMYFYLKGTEGVVQFILSTNWHLPHVQNELDFKMDSKYPHLSCHPMPYDLGYHSPIPQHEGQTTVNEECDILDGKPCYYDGSTLNAQPIYEKLLKEGDEGMWSALEEFYNEIFKGGDNG